MAIHPPNLYLGYVATSIPFAFAIAALITRRLDAEWLAAVRRWSLVSWLFLTIGITLGMWWAYVELGWGGYWAWDPVENASLLPWLTGTAFLHSIMIQEKRGMLRKWNVTLVVATFLLSILGTFITRSGVIESVHSFAQSPIGTWFASFLIVAIVVTAFLVATRLKDLEARAELESMVSREAAFLYNNVVLVGIAFSVLWGTLFPIISEAVRGSKITVGPPFFNTVNIPLGLLLLGANGNRSAHRVAACVGGESQATVRGAGRGRRRARRRAVRARHARRLRARVVHACRASSRRRSAQEFVKGVGARRRMHDEAVPVALLRLVARNRRRYGGYIVHFGVVVLFAAFAGLAFKKEYDLSLTPGASFSAVDPYNRIVDVHEPGDFALRGAQSGGDGGRARGEAAGMSPTLIKSEKRQHVDSRGIPTFEPSTEVGILESLRQDVYLVLHGVSGRGDSRDSHHVQSAGVVGVVRRHHHGDRRPDRHVAAGDASGYQASCRGRVRGGDAAGAESPTVDAGVCG